MYCLNDNGKILRVTYYFQIKQYYTIENNAFWKIICHFQESSLKVSQITPYTLIHYSLH